MRNRLKLIGLLALVTFSVTSCFVDDYLEPVPRTAISDLSAFDTKDRIVSQVNGMYNAFRSGQYLGGRYQVYNEIRGDDFLNRQSNGVTGYLTWNHTLTASANEVQNLWGQVYSAINTVNVFLEGLTASKPVEKGILTQAEFDQFKGEALALRALAHFHLAQLYAWPYNYSKNAPGVILRLKANKSSAENDKARSTNEETYLQILTDLNDAENLLPTIPAGTSNAVQYVTRIHKSTVIALKTRVYLHMNKWSDVIAEANKIVNPTGTNSIAGVTYNLVTNFIDVFRAPYTKAEHLFYMPFNASELPGTQNSLSHYFTAGPIGANEYPINLSSQTWTNPAFPANDSRKQLVTVASGDTYLNKYSVQNTDWAPVIRWAEVLLNLAEAEAMNATGVSQRAVDLLNAVYLRSNPTATPYTTADFADKNALKSRILAERGMEFLGEGLKNMDTMRNLLPHAAKPTVSAVPVNSVAYVWPIPQTELNTNALVQRNDPVPAP